MKPALILDAARNAFFGQDYDTVTMDEVARRAGVVKQTIYSYYPSKDALFAAVHKRECEQIGRLLKAAPSTTSSHISTLLRTMGEDCLEVLLSPSFRDLTKVTIAAARRFPSLGKLIYDGTILPFIQQFADILRNAMDHGLLRTDDPLRAALQFIALLRGELFFHCLFDPGFVPTQEAKAQQVSEAVSCFIAKYGVVAAVRPISVHPERK